MSNVYKVIDKLQDFLANVADWPERVSVQVPKSLQFGDLTTNIALIKAKADKKDPMVLAENLVEKIKNEREFAEIFSKVEAVRPGFINFYYSVNFLAKEFNTCLLAENYGQINIGKGKKIVVEYSSPNTNKPLHVGHLRNNALGMALAKMLDFLGFKVIKTEVVNDRGIHIMKSMLAYQLYGQGKTPESEGVKSDKFVGDYYVLYSQLEKKDPSIKAKAQEMLVKWEKGDKAVRELWAKMNNWTYQGWERTYKLFDSEFDEREFESNIYDKGKEIILEAAKKGLVKKREDGALVIDLSKYGLGDRESGEKILLRSDGTTVYITQDIYLAQKRYEKHKFDKMIYVVGDEQIYHFKVLFKILEIFGFSWNEKLLHYPYAHVLLPEGKMKSREGKVVDADDLLFEMFEMSMAEIKKREEAGKNDFNERAWGIALAAIKYWFLKSNARSTLLFDPKKSLDLEGNTGPYILYSYVRLNRILEKAGFKKPSETVFEKFTDDELNIIRHMVRWPLVLLNFSQEYALNLITDFVYQFAGAINTYYQSVPILHSQAGREEKLNLIYSADILFETILKLLNFRIIKKM